MYDFNYHMTSRLIKNHIFCMKMSIFCHITQPFYGRHYVTLQK